MEEKKLNIGEKFWGVVVNPQQTFKRIGEDSQILVPALVILAVNAVLAWLIIPETMAYTESLMKSSAQTMPPEALNAAMTAAKISILAAAVLGPPLVWLIQTVLLSLIKQLTVGEGGFKQLFAVSFFAWFPPFLGGAIKSLLIKIIGLESVMAIQTSLALFLPSSASTGFWPMLLAKADFFALWGLVLLAWGGATVMKKDPYKIGIYVFAAWLVYVVVVAYFGAKFGNVPAV